MGDFCSNSCPLKEGCSGIRQLLEPHNNCKEMTMKQHTTEQTASVTEANMKAEHYQSSQEGTRRKNGFHCVFHLSVFAQHEHRATNPELLQVCTSFCYHKLQTNVLYFTGESTWVTFECSPSAQYATILWCFILALLSSHI